MAKSKPQKVVKSSIDGKFRKSIDAINDPEHTVTQTIHKKKKPKKG